MKRVLALVLAALFLAACPGNNEPPSADTGTTTGTSTQVPGDPQRVQYTAINSSVYVPADTINGWIGATPIDTQAMAQHAWQIWGGMTADSGQQINGQIVPVWETWYDSTEVYQAGPGSGAQNSGDTAAVAARPQHQKSHPKRRFHFPDQFFKKAHGLGVRAALPSGSLPGILLSFNRFTQEMKDHVATNRYYDQTVLTNLNNSWPANTPLENRTIQTFPNTSIMLKPVFWVIPGNQATPVPYWAGNGSNATSNAQNPTPDTWKQCVLADPTGQAKNDQPIDCNGTQLAAGSYQVVPVSTDPTKSAFYAIQLTQAEIDDLKLLNQNEVLGGSNVQVNQLKAGDYALFVASHVSTREIDNWTWQTFWWSPDPQNAPNLPENYTTAPATIAEPWNNYVACTAYYMVAPPTDSNGKPLYCFNPYLETGLTQLQNEPRTSGATGVASNCMTCHRAAAWPTNDYAQAFLLQPNDAKWFTGNTKVDFAWSMQNFAHSAPFVP